MVSFHVKDPFCSRMWLIHFKMMMLHFQFVFKLRWPNFLNYLCQLSMYWLQQQLTDQALHRLLWRPSGPENHLTQRKKNKCAKQGRDKISRDKADQCKAGGQLPAAVCELIIVLSGRCLINLTDVSAAPRVINSARAVFRLCKLYLQPCCHFLFEENPWKRRERRWKHPCCRLRLETGFNHPNTRASFILRAAVTFIPM